MNGQSQQNDGDLDFVFRPRCVEIGDCLIFDTACTIDLARSVRCVVKPKGSFSIELGPDRVDDDDGVRCLSVSLLIRIDDQTSELAVMRIAIGQATTRDMLDAIRNRSADAVFNAISGQSQPLNFATASNAHDVPGFAVVEHQAAATGREMLHESKARGAKQVLDRPWLGRIRELIKSPNNVNFFIVAPLVVFIVFFFWFKTDRTPEDKALGLLQADPAAVEAQVALTRETLKQMGIDPGKPSDLGCLAPK